MEEVIKILPRYRVSVVKKKIKTGGRKKKTHDEYVVELAMKNPTIEVVSKYVDAKTKITHHCLLHDIYWDVLPGNALAGKGCKECMKDKNRTKFTKSHDEYVSQVQNVNSDIEVLETYIGADVAILHLCRKHNVQWKAMPTNILKGCGCVKCKSEKIIEKQLKTHEQYVEELSIKSPNLKVIEEYIDSVTPILHYCIKHDNYWKVCPNNALNRNGCPECGKESHYELSSKSHDDYVFEVSAKNPNIEVVEKYINGRTKIMHYCLLHDVYWMAYPYSILQGCGCFECGKEKISSSLSKSHETYVEELKIINPNVIAIERYIDMKTPILHKCLIHNVEWITSPSATLQGCGCPECRSEKISEKSLKTHEQYIEELKITNPSMVVLEQYINANTPILHKCLKDENEWYISPSNALIGYGCPRCHESKGERQIRLWLDKHNISYEFQKKFEVCRDSNLLPFDFYLPNYNMCIEYDGKQHFEPIEHFGGQEAFEITAKHDNIKNDYCKNNGISLLRIPYFKNVEEELNNFLLY